MGTELFESQQCQTQLDPHWNKPTVKRHFRDDGRKLNTAWGFFFLKSSSVRFYTELFMG